MWCQFTGTLGAREVERTVSFENQRAVSRQPRN
jgi:hypothetical protein